MHKMDLHGKADLRIYSYIDALTESFHGNPYRYATNVHFN